MLSDFDPRSDWRFPVGASLCGVGGLGNPMPMDFLGGHTLSSMGFSAAAVGLFVLGTVWMFRRWGGAGGAEAPTVLEDESEAIWAELEEHLDGDRVPDTTEAEAHEPV